MIWYRVKIGMMIVAVTCMSVARGLPTGCSENAHCPIGFYCESERLLCRECLRCEDLSREPPLAPVSACVTSAVECGPCLRVPGLEVDERNEDAGCLPSGSQEDKQGFPLYGWAVIGSALVIATLLISVIAAYALRNFRTFKIVTTTQMQHSGVSESMAMASAPLPPPPYNSVAILPASHTLAQESWPFIKSVSIGGEGEARESAESQAARVFNNPAYVREPLLPPSYQAEASGDESNDTHSTAREDITNNNVVCHNGNALTAKEADRIQPPETTPAPKVLRVRQDSNSSGENVDDGPEGTHRSLLAQSGTAFIINVIKNVNMAQHNNDVTLS